MTCRFDLRIPPSGIHLLTVSLVALLVLMGMIPGPEAAASGVEISVYVRNQPFNGQVVRHGDQFFLELEPLLRSLNLGAAVEDDGLAIVPGQPIALPEASAMPEHFIYRNRTDNPSHVQNGTAYLVDVYDFTQLLGLTYRFNALSRILDIYAPPHPPPVVVSPSTPSTSPSTGGTTTGTGAGGVGDDGPTNYDYVFTFRNVSVAYDWAYDNPGYYSLPGYYGNPWNISPGPYINPWYGGMRRFSGGHVTGQLFNDYHRTATDIQVQVTTSDSSTVFTIPRAAAGDNTPFSSPNFMSSWSGPIDPRVELKIIKARWE